DLLWSGSFDRTIKVWNLADKTCMGTLTSEDGGHVEPITCMTIVPSSDGDYVATGGVDGFVKMWNASGEMLWERDEGAVISALYAAVDSF
ncbi:TUP1, partial [Symbiodinium microadriaticum]